MSDSRILRLNETNGHVTSLEYTGNGALELPISVKTRLREKRDSLEETPPLKAGVAWHKSDQSAPKRTHVTQTIQSSGYGSQTRQPTMRKVPYSAQEMDGELIRPLPPLTPREARIKNLPTFGSYQVTSIFKYLIALCK